MKKVLAILLAALLALSAFAGCSQSKKADSVTCVLVSDIVALDPARMYDSSTMPVLGQVLENLLEQQMDGSMQPLLAKEWKVLDDNLTYVYQIRDDVRFSDGKAMTMEDVLYSLERHRDEEVASYVGWMYENVESLEQTGDWELTVKLYEPDATWQYVFGTAAGAVFEKEAAEKAGDDFGRSVSGLIGTGPYVIDSWTVGSEIKMHFNTDYWNKTYSNPDVKNITFTVISEDTTRMSALIGGQVDIDLWLPANLLSQAEEAESVTVKLKPSGDFFFLSMNCSKEPFDDVNVRRAIASAIPRADINSTIVKDSGELAKGLPMSSYLYTFERESWEQYAKTKSGYDYDLAKAKEYLAASSHPDGFSATLIVDETAINNSVALVIQEELAKIGIEITIERMSYDEIICHEFGSYVDENGNNIYEMGLFDWEADWPDPSGNVMGIFNSAYSGEGGTNVPNYVNEAADELLNEQATVLDPAQRTQLLQQALDIIIDEAPVVPISYMNYKIGFSKKIADFDTVTWNSCFKNMKLS